MSKETSHASKFRGRSIRDLGRAERKGAVLALVAVSTVGLLSLLALAIDGGALQREKRLIQTAADAGALAGAVEIFRNRTDSVSFAANSETSRNGFANGANGNTITVTWPSTSARYSGSKFVTVEVSRVVPTNLANIFGQNAVTVRATATAGIVLAEYCFIVLDPTGNHTLEVNNQAKLIGSGCGIDVNSTSATGAYASGQAQISAPSIGVSGSAVDGNAGAFSPAAKYNVPPTPDPLAYLVKPPVPATCDFGSAAAPLKITGTITLNPGTYCGGMDLKPGANVTLTQGLYILRGGGLNIVGGGSTLRSTGTGVTFFNTAPPPGASYTWGPIFIQSSTVTLDIAANTDPSSALPGVLFYSDPAAPNLINVFKAGSVSRMDGTMYFPTQTVQFGSGATFTINGALVANRVQLSNNLQVTFTGYNGGADFFALKRPTIVE
ncbi:MAG: pilus assembly protein TadG-related protein [Gemmatimonadales bacterium]